MLAINLISSDIPPLKNSDTGRMAVQWMDEFKVSHLPVLDEGKYIGLVSDADLLDLNSPDEALSTQLKELDRPFVLDSEHIYNVIKLINDLSVTAVPVLDQEDEFLGIISLQELIHQMSTFAAVNLPGGIVVLEMNKSDYSMAELSQIVEQNNAQILSSFITSPPESTKIEVTLKINQTNLGGILQTFNRYDYSVKASFQESSNQDDLKRRFDELMNYLNI